MFAAALLHGVAGAADATAEKLFHDTCARCHGAALAPGVLVAPELRGRRLSVELVASVARNGGSRMPPFRRTEISDSDLQALGRWIQASAAPAPPGAPR